MRIWYTYHREIWGGRERERHGVWRGRERKTDRQRKRDGLIDKQKYEEVERDRQTERESEKKSVR